MSASGLSEVRLGGTAQASAVPSRGLDSLTSARLAGVLYVVIIVFGIFAEVVVRSRLVDFDNASTTATNILDSQRLFRAGFAADLIVFLCDVALAIVLYLLFRPVSRTLSMLAAVFRLTQTAIIGLNLLSMFMALLILTRADYIGEFTTSQSQALALLFLDMHRYGYTLGLTFFGVSTLLIAYLVMRSGCMPRALGVLLGLAGAGYIIDSAAFFLVPGYEGGASAVILAPALVGEVWFALWLLIKGHRLQALSEQTETQGAA